MNSVARINLDHLVSNINYLKSKIHSSEIYPVIKSNAYGHGSIKIAKILSKNSIKTVCVATCNEILEILNEKTKLNIFHLGKIVLCKKNMNKKVIFTIHSLSDINYIKSKCKRENYTIRCHIKVDTGMGRLGCSMQDFIEIFKLAIKSNYIELEGIYSHLSCADNKKSDYNKKQINNFEYIINQVKKYDLKFHLLNSAGIFNYNKFSYNYVRSGLAIYGISPLGKLDKNLKPVMEFSAPVVLYKEIKKGDKIGYGCTFHANKKMKVAIIQCGYGDGIPIEFSNKGYVFYKKYKFPIVGRVSMDLICIDITGYNEKNKIDKVIIWGGENIYSRLEYIANNFNTIPYIYLIGITNRVERVYV
jgi:alanine racemase